MSENGAPDLSAFVEALDAETAQLASAILQTLLQSDGHAGPFAQLLGIKFEAFGEGRCVAILDVQTYMFNRASIGHGGIAYTLADTACGGAAFSAIGEPRLVTQDMQIRYHAPVREGTIRATAEVLHRGRRTISAQCRVTQDEVLVASATGTFAILNDEELARLR